RAGAVRGAGRRPRGRGFHGADGAAVGTLRWYRYRQRRQAECRDRTYGTKGAMAAGEGAEQWREGPEWAAARIALERRKGQRVRGPLAVWPGQNEQNSNLPALLLAAIQMSRLWAAAGAPAVPRGGDTPRLNRRTAGEPPDDSANDDAGEAGDHVEANGPVARSGVGQGGNGLVAGR
ncbi:hypothetical protein Vafri_15739, partial [Volvox africanus]